VAVGDAVKDGDCV